MSERRLGATAMDTRNLAESIRDVLAGARPETRLPSQFELAQRFGVSRHLVRRALEKLRDEGLIEGLMGARASAHQDVGAYAISSRTRFASLVAASGVCGSAARVVLRQRRPSDTAAAQLGIARWRPVRNAVILREVDRLPFSMSLHYFAPGLDRVEASMFGDRAILTRALVALGVSDYRRSSTTVRSRLPTPTERHVFRIGARDPVLVVIRCNTDRRSRPVEVSETVFPATRVELLLEPP